MEEAQRQLDAWCAAHPSCFGRLYRRELGFDAVVDGKPSGRPMCVELRVLLSLPDMQITRTHSLSEIEMCYALDAPARVALMLVRSATRYAECRQYDAPGAD